MALIMLADDEMAFCDSLRDFLQSRGHQVVMVHDGTSAALKAIEWKPHLVIMDIQMPGGYGSTAYQVLEREGVTKSTPVLFVTGVPLERAAHVLPPGAAVLPKPLDYKRLEELLTSMLPKLGNP